MLLLLFDDALLSQTFCMYIQASHNAFLAEQEVAVSIYHILPEPSVLSCEYLKQSVLQCTDFLLMMVLYFTCKVLVAQLLFLGSWIAGRSFP